MRGIITDLQRRLANLIESRQAALTIAAEWPVALGHKPWVLEIWVNYLSNALEYGGRPPQIELGTTVQPDGFGRFWVRDQGPGITPEDQQRLFAPFTKLHQVRTKGHGLGLSIVQRIVTKLGGEVGVESEPGRGSLFWFTLPLVD